MTAFSQTTHGAQHTFTVSRNSSLTSLTTTSPFATPYQYRELADTITQSASSMTRVPHFGVGYWQVHDVKDDCSVIIRANNGVVFYCEIHPSHFVRSPSVARQYSRCQSLVRSCGAQDDLDGFYHDDAEEWLLKAFEPLVLQLLSSTRLPEIENPTLSDYLCPLEYFVCALDAVDDQLQPVQLDTRDSG